jgi:aminoglycoside phosphotransferase (APT) family kinase protein
MEFTTISRPVDTLQQPVTLEEIIKLCQRAFGEGCFIKSVNELGGGLYNNTYLIKLESMLPVILRVSPPMGRLAKSDRNLMRNEYATLPFFAPIALLLPKVILADFTHQLIDRDYLFQSYIEGEQWSQIKNELKPGEKKALWRQLGAITRQIHNVKGEVFGNPFLDAAFPSWSATINNRFSGLIHDLDSVGLATDDLREVLAIAQNHAVILDEITQPALLHGDLWLVNILVNRNFDEPKIVGIIDNDRASWGDPLADWTIFILERNADAEEAAFWETYGLPERTGPTQFRTLVYRGFYTGAIRLEQFRLNHHKAVKQTYEDVRLVIDTLKSFDFSGKL